MMCFNEIDECHRANLPLYLFMPEPKNHHIDDDFISSHFISQKNITTYVKFLFLLVRRINERTVVIKKKENNLPVD